jgi:hypothetical protein
MLIAVIILFKYYGEIVKSSPYRLLSIVLLLSIAVGVHGLSHLGLEQSYGLNPFTPFNVTQCRELFTNNKKANKSRNGCSAKHVGRGSGRTATDTI